MSLDTILSRLRSYETIGQRALPGAAIRIANVLRTAIKDSRKHQVEKRTNALIESGVTDKKAIRRALRKLRAKHRKGSGIKILSVGDDEKVKITHSTQVGHFAELKDEHKDWITVFREAVRAAGAEVK